MHIGPLFDYSIDDRYPVFAGKSMIDTFLKAIYHTYFFDNEKSIKMNDTYDRYFFTRGEYICPPN